MVLVDGFVRGFWSTARDGAAATLLVEPFQALTKRQAAAVTREAAQLLRFVAGDAESHDVRLRPSE
jgi:hypothetical protein